jgi:hypothetical protein
MSGGILGGPLNANNQLINNVADPINNLDAVNLQTLKSNVSIEVYNAGENINSHTAVVLINNLLYAANRTNLSHYFAFVGFTLTSVVTGNTVNVQTKGVISLSGWGLTPNAYYQLDNGSGMITNTPPSGSGFNQVVGFAESANSLLILKNIPILT